MEAGLPSWNSLRSRTRSSARRCWIWPQRRCRWWWPRTCWAAQRTRRTRRWWRRLDQARDWRPPERGSRNHPGWYGTRWSWEDRDTYQFQAQKKTLKNKNWIKAPWHKETPKQGRGRSMGLRIYSSGVRTMLVRARTISRSPRVFKYKGYHLWSRKSFVDQSSNKRIKNIFISRKVISR